MRTGVGPVGAGPEPVGSDGPLGPRRRSRPHRRGLRGAGLVAASCMAAAAVLVSSAGPAAALSDVYVHKTRAVMGYSVVEAAFHLDKTVTAAAGLTAENPTTPMGHAVVYLVQCDGLGHRCGTIAANSTTGGRVDGVAIRAVSTSKKRRAAGHIYKACATLTDWTGATGVNVCTDFLAYSG